MHSLPMKPPPATSSKCDTYSSGWDGYLSAKPITICDGHSTIRCALRGRGLKTSGYFCWIVRPYVVSARVNGTVGREWHAFCQPTHHWSGSVDDPLLVQTFGKLHNHFNPSREARNIRPYVRVRDPSELPAHLRVDGSRQQQPAAGQHEVAYLLNGDQVTLPNFNPFHGSADVLNLFVVQRMLATPSIGGTDGARLSTNMSLYPLSGCVGMGPGRGTHELWRVLIPGAIHPPASYLRGGAATARATARGQRRRHFGRSLEARDNSSHGVRSPSLRLLQERHHAASLWWSHNGRAEMHTGPGGSSGGGSGGSGGGISKRRKRAATAHQLPWSASRSQRSRQQGRPAVRFAAADTDLAFDDAALRPIAAAVLSPHPRSAPIWAIPSKDFRRCPHRSAVLHDFRSAMVAQLDSVAAPLESLLSKGQREERSSPVRIFEAPRVAATDAPNASARLVYFVRRSHNRANVDTSLSCHRCLWNVERLCTAIARVLPPRSRVVLTNPGELPFAQQYALFRHSDLLLGVHGSAFAWGLFLTPTQAVVELPLPGSPGLNDWLFATLGARTACVQACVPTAPARGSRGCSEKGGDADVPVVVQSVLDLLREPHTSQERPMMWHQLGWKSNAMYGRSGGRRPSLV